MSQPRPLTPPAPASMEPAGLTEEDAALLCRIARFLAQKKLILPALMFLESLRPLNLLACQTIYFSLPFVSLFARDAGMAERFGALLERRESIDYLIHLLEEAEAAS